GLQEAGIGARDGIGQRAAAGVEAIDAEPGGSAAEDGLIGDRVERGRIGSLSRLVVADNDLVAVSGNVELWAENIVGLRVAGILELGGCVGGFLHIHAQNVVGVERFVHETRLGSTVGWIGVEESAGVESGSRSEGAGGPDVEEVFERDVARWGAGGI